MDKPHLDPNTKLLTEEYAEGVGEFMRLVHQQPEANTGMLRCLCSSCNNNRILREWDVQTHLYMRGFTQNYKVWCLHVENGYEYGSTSEPQHVESIFVCSIRMSLVPCRFNKSKNGISRCINQMMYSMLRKGYPTYSVIPNDECHLWFRNFAKELWLNGKTPKYINPTVWLELQEHWVDQETIDKSIKNSANRNNDRGGKGIYVHNLGACSMSSKEDELPISDDDSSAASTNITRVRIHQIVEQAVPKKKGRLVGLARRASSCPSSSQAPFAPVILRL
uniref:Transposase-associated domain-containing protein n=1 Tax=Brassica oleracea var. oleracea TaxID=109376 RepID=A0A0D3BWA4_BRAOL